jgi:hypothetical protein
MRTSAARLPPSTLRTLDVLHVSSAATLIDLHAFVAYDARLLEAAGALGLPLAAPGASIFPDPQM